MFGVWHNSKYNIKYTVHTLCVGWTCSRPCRRFFMYTGQWPFIAIFTTSTFCSARFSYICCIVVCCLRCAVLWLLLHVCSQHSNIQHHHFEAIPHHVILCFNYRFTSIYFGICRPHTLARSTTHITHAHFGRYCNVSSHSLNVINFCPFLSVMGINCINLIRIMCLVDAMVVLLFLDITALDIV